MSKYIFDNINTDEIERIVTGTDAKTKYIKLIHDAPVMYQNKENLYMQNIDTKSIITLVVAVAVSVAFMFVVIAPAFNVIVPQTTSAMVFAMFGALAGFGGSQYGEAQATKRLLTMQGK